ncbi:hypothetical protein PCPL58_p2019 (plasmid) [Pseudomonas cerasi]|uniref:Uncharacterized protein n=1 Tax=Pseudomonas cerasi TaxID=1583341 RepID=A0A193SG54_9PSED|nr:hypothetical protein PCPL58_p2019 [Pseudomonas cerasi]SOS30448.1 hypothetical protein PL963_P400076 [Pseudomonas cerasi]
MQQLINLGDIRHVSSRAYYAVHQPRRGVDTNVGLHPKVPLITFFSLMHLGITLAFSILDRGRRGDQGSVDDSAFLEQQTSAGQMLVNCSGSRWKTRVLAISAFFGSDYLHVSGAAGSDYLHSSSRYLRPAQIAGCPAHAFCN